MSEVEATYRFLGRPSPFKVERIEAELPCSYSVGRAVRESGIAKRGYATLRVTLNDAVVPADAWEETFPEGGDFVTAIHVPRDPVTIFLAISFAVADALVAVGVGGVVAGSIGLVAGVVGTAAIFVGGAFLLNLAVTALVGGGESDRLASTSNRQSPTAAGVGNQLLPDRPVWRNFGKMRLYPPHAARPLRSYKGELGVTRVLLTPGYGKQKMSDIKVGATPIGRFRETTLSLYDGTPGSPTTTDFPRSDILDLNVRIEDKLIPGAAWPEGYPWFSFALETDADRIRFEMAFPNGLARTTENGSQTHAFFAITIQYREVGAPDWILVNGPVVSQFVPPPGISLTDKGTYWEAFASRYGLAPFSIVVVPPSRGVFEARVRVSPKTIDPSYYTPDRGGTGGNTGQLITDLLWRQFRGEIDESALDVPFGLSLIDLTLPDESGSGNQGDQLNVLCEGYVRVWDKLGQSWVSGEAWLLQHGGEDAYRNPAWQALEIARGEANPDVLEDEKIDLDSFADLAARCDTYVPIPGGTEPLHRCDGPFDFDGSVLEAMNEVLGVAFARADYIDNRLTVVVDAPASKTPKQLFTPRNIVSGSLAIHRRFDGEPHALRCEFVNETTDYKKDERVIYNDGYARRDATTGSQIAMTAVRNGNLVTFTRGSGLFSDEGFEADGFVTIDSASLAATQFLMESMSSDGDQLVVYDPDSLIPTGDTSFRMVCTGATSFERFTLRMVTRPTEVWRQGRRRLREGRLRPRVIEFRTDWEWLLFTPGDCVELMHDAPIVGIDSFRVIDWTEGTGPDAGKVTELRLDGVAAIGSDPLGYGIRLRTIKTDGTLVMIQAKIHEANTATLRAASGDEWIALESTYYFDAAANNIRKGSDVGSLLSFGVWQYETIRLLVTAITKSADLTAKITALDLAPEIEDEDTKPIPPFQSGIVHTQPDELIPPPPPSFVVEDKVISTGVTTLDVALGVVGWNQSFATLGVVPGMDAVLTGAGASDGTYRVVSLPSSAEVQLAGLSGIVAGDGDEQLVFYRRSAKTTIDVDAEGALGTFSLVVPSATQGAGYADLVDDSASGAFADFRGSGYVSIEQGFTSLDGNDGLVNLGLFEIHSKPNNDTLILVDPGDMASESGDGDERVTQSQLHRASGDFTSELIVADEWVRLVGMQNRGVFRALAASALDVAVEDDSLLLVDESGTGDERLVATRPLVRYDMRGTLPDGTYDLWATVSVSRGEGTGSATTALVAEYRVRDSAGIPEGGWIRLGRYPADTSGITFGPLKRGPYFDFRMRAVSDQGFSAWVAITHQGVAGRPAAPINLRVLPDIVVRPEGVFPGLRVLWNPADGGYATFGYKLRWRVDNGSFTQVDVKQLAESTVEYALGVARYGIYTIEVVAIGLDGSPSDPATVTYEHTSEPLFERMVVRNLELRGRGNDTIFTGKDADFDWALPALLLDPSLGEDGGVGDGSTGGARDPLFDEFIVVPVDPSLNELRQPEYFRNPGYLYSYDKNLADGGPRRDFGLKVRMRDVYGRVSDPAILMVSNPAPPTPSAVQLNSQGQTVFATITPGLNPDGTRDRDRDGFLIFASATSGFTPSSQNLVARAYGRSASFRSPVATGSLYVKVAEFDSFFDVENIDLLDVPSLLNVSTQLTVAISPVGLAPGAVEAEHISVDAILPQHVKFWLIKTSGLLANRPAAGTEGRWFYATDTGQVFYDDGASWVEQVADPEGVFAKTGYAFEVNASKVNVGVLAAERIGARTIAVEHLAVTSFFNHLLDPVFQTIGAKQGLAATNGRVLLSDLYWVQAPASWLVGDEATLAMGFAPYAGDYMLRCDPSAAGGAPAVQIAGPMPGGVPGVFGPAVLPASEGDGFVARFFVRASGTPSGDYVRAFVGFFDKSGNWLASGYAPGVAADSLAIAGGWVQVESSTGVAPAGAAYAVGGVVVSDEARLESAKYAFDSGEMRRTVGAALIESVRAEAISAGTIVADIGIGVGNLLLSSIGAMTLSDDDSMELLRLGNLGEPGNPNWGLQIRNSEGNIIYDISAGGVTALGITSGSVSELVAESVLARGPWDPWPWYTIHEFVLPASAEGSKVVVDWTYSSQSTGTMRILRDGAELATAALAADGDRRFPYPDLPAGPGSSEYSQFIADFASPQSPLWQTTVGNPGDGSGWWRYEGHVGYGFGPLTVGAAPDPGGTTAMGFGKNAGYTKSPLVHQWPAAAGIHPYGQTIDLHVASVLYEVWIPQSLYNALHTDNAIGLAFHSQFGEYGGNFDRNGGINYFSKADLDAIAGGPAYDQWVSIYAPQIPSILSSGAENPALGFFDFIFGPGFYSYDVYRTHSFGIFFTTTTTAATSSLWVRKVHLLETAGYRYKLQVNGAADIRHSGHVTMVLKA